MRLAGDLLPTSLFVPYLGMLTGLSSSPQGAHHCFNLLKSSTNSTLSWDHFFTSIKQYYMEMRQSAGHTGTCRHTHRHIDLLTHTQSITRSQTYVAVHTVWGHFFTSIKQYYMEMRQNEGHTGTCRHTDRHIDLLTHTQSITRSQTYVAVHTVWITSSPPSNSITWR